MNFMAGVQGRIDGGIREQRERKTEGGKIRQSRRGGRSWRTGRGKRNGGCGRRW